MLPLYVDIDGTLTDKPNQGGKVYPERISKIKEILKSGREVVLWTGGGTRYAKQFAKEHGLDGVICIGKPVCCIDDNPTIRPAGRMLIKTPEEFFT